MHVWSGSHASYDNIDIFGCPFYYHVCDEKLDPRAQNILLLGMSDGVKGFKLWYIQDKKIVISNDKVSILKMFSVEKFSSSGEGEKQVIEQGGGANGGNSFIGSFGYRFEFKF